MQARPEPWRRLVLAYLEYAAGRLDLRPGASPGDGRAMQAWLGDEIERAFAPSAFRQTALVRLCGVGEPARLAFKKPAGRGREMMHA
jgi:hypothetical protein